MLFGLKSSLQKEFAVDVWEESLEKVGEGDIKALYYTYAELAIKKIREYEQISVNEAV